MVQPGGEPVGVDVIGFLFRQKGGAHMEGAELQKIVHGSFQLREVLNVRECEFTGVIVL
jgi:hypothetical protein